MKMNPFQRCVGCVLCLTMLLSMSGCEKRTPVKMDRVETLFQQIQDQHPTVESLGISFRLPHFYDIEIVMKPYNSREMYAVLEQIHDTITEEPFQKEYLEDAKEQVGYPYFEQGSRPFLVMRIHEAQWLGMKKRRAEFTAAYQPEEKKHFDYWIGNEAPSPSIMSNEEIKEIFAAN